MAHKTLISGTAYSVTGGRELIGGTGYDCKAGKTLIGGTAFTVPFSKGIPLNTITPGAILYLNESGSPVPFYIAKHDYESGLNGAGRTLVVRKDCYDMRAFSNGTNDYTSSQLGSWLNSAYLNLLTNAMKKMVGTTKLYSKQAVLERSVFQLSLTELGKSNSNAYTEGAALSIAAKLWIAYRNGGTVHQWTRTGHVRFNGSAFILASDGNAGWISCEQSAGSRPAFTLPAAAAVIANADGTYTLAA